MRSPGDAADGVLRVMILPRHFALQACLLITHGPSRPSPSALPRFHCPCFRPAPHMCHTPEPQKATSTQVRSTRRAMQMLQTCEISLRLYLTRARRLGPRRCELV